MSASRPRLLDLFSGAGGASVGYHRAGFEVVGVDIDPMPRYPYDFIQADALEVLDDADFIRGFDALHASPPCQRYSVATKRSGEEAVCSWPDLVGPVRAKFQEYGLPWVIENVVGSPLRDPITLCGTMFPGLRVLRHRLFESNFPIPQPEHHKHPLVFTHDKRKPHYGKLDQDTAFIQVTGGGNSTLANARDAMGIDWMTKHELNEAIPPAYTEYVGDYLLAEVEARTKVAA